MTDYDTQEQLVYNALLRGSQYCNIEGCNALRIGCYQRIISFLRNDYGLPVRDISVTTEKRNGRYKRYFLSDETIKELRDNGIKTPAAAREYYVAKMRAQAAQMAKG